MTVSSPTFRDGAKARAVAEWRKGRKDTLAIAHTTGLKQHEVCSAIAADQDARHRARAWTPAELRNRAKMLRQAGFEP